MRLPRKLLCGVLNSTSTFFWFEQGEVRVGQRHLAGGVELLAVVQLTADAAGVVVDGDGVDVALLDLGAELRVGEVLAALPRHQRRDEQRRGRAGRGTPRSPTSGCLTHRVGRPFGPLPEPSGFGRRSSGPRPFPEGGGGGSWLMRPC